MKRENVAAKVAVLALPAIVAGAALAAQDRYALQVPGGLAFSEFRGYENWQIIAASHNGDKIAIILGNPMIIDAYRSGVPENGKPFPDGAKMAKIHWMAKKAEDQPGEPVVPGALHDTDFMVKDSKRFVDSGGWGWAEFEYDPASETFRPGDTSDSPPQEHGRQVRIRLPHDRAGTGLRFHGLPETVKALPPSARAKPALECSLVASIGRLRKEAAGGINRPEQWTTNERHVQKECRKRQYKAPFRA